MRSWRRTGSGTVTQRGDRLTSRGDRGLPLRSSFPIRHPPVTAARFRRVQFQDAAIELLERGTCYTADSPGVGSIGSDAEAIRQSQQVARSPSSTIGLAATVDGSTERYDLKRVVRLGQPWSGALLTSFAQYQARAAFDHPFDHRGPM